MDLKARIGRVIRLAHFAIDVQITIPWQFYWKRTYAKYRNTILTLAVLFLLLLGKSRTSHVPRLLQLVANRVQVGTAFGFAVWIVNKKRSVNHRSPARLTRALV